MDYTKGEWKFEKSDLTIRSNDFKRGSQMGDYKGVIVADLKPALGCDYSDNVDLEHTGRSHAVPQTLANAHLIASAPDLYEACLTALGVMATLDQSKGWVKEISRVIQKALSKAEDKDGH